MSFVNQLQEHLPPLRKLLLTQLLDLFNVSIFVIAVFGIYVTAPLYAFFIAVAGIISCGLLFQIEYSTRGLVAINVLSVGTLSIAFMPAVTEPLTVTVFLSISGATAIISSERLSEYEKTLF